MVHIQMCPHNPPDIEEKPWCVDAATGSYHPNGIPDRLTAIYANGVGVPHDVQCLFLTPKIDSFRHQDASYT